VRSGTRWEGREIPPEQREYSAADIKSLTEALKNIGFELWKLRREIEPPPAEDELISAAKQG
jgi:hypothetical protein